MRLTLELEKRLAQQRASRHEAYRILCVHRAVLREEGCWVGVAFGAKLIEQDCTRLVLRLARWPFPM